MSSTIKQRIADIQRGNVPAGYRKTKCGIIPDTWSCCQPKEIFSGKSIKNNDSELPVLSVTQGNGVMLRSEMDKDISYKEDSVSSYKRVDIGDFVISLRSFEGGIEYSQCKGVVSPAYTIFSHSEDVDGSFYKYYFKTDFFINKLNTAVYGIRDGKQIGFQDFSNLFIHCPPLEAQRRITEILGCCDRVIALKKELIAEKKKQKKALMQKLLNPDSGFRIPGFSGEWKRTKMENIAPLQRGFDLPNSQLKQGEYPVVYSNGVMAFHNKFMVTAPGVVTGRSGTIGAVFYIENNFWPHNTSLWVTNFFNNIPLFVYHLYQFINIEKCASGSGVPTLNRNDVHKIEISIPCDKDEQQAIADILSAADKEIDLLEQELVQLEQKKKSLMQLLLTGIVRV